MAGDGGVERAGVLPRLEEVADEGECLGVARGGGVAALGLGGDLLLEPDLLAGDGLALGDVKDR